MDATINKKQADKLLFYGFLLFLLGLVTGLLVPVLANTRMGLSSHIEGVMNGMFLIILGLVWHKVELPQKWLKATFLLAIYGTFMNWLGILIAAAFNAGKMLNIAAQGVEGHPFAEDVVNFSLVSLTVAMLLVSIAVLSGLRRNMKQIKNNSVSSKVIVPEN